jgi:hypothetical protein
MKHFSFRAAICLFASLVALAMASHPTADLNLQTPSQLSDDEDPNPDTHDPYAGFPPLPEHSKPIVWNQFPLDQSFLFDPEWYDTTGIDMIVCRRIFASRSKVE